MRASEVLKKDVVTSDGARVGRVVDLEIRGWRVDGLIVQLSSETAQAAGMRKLLRRPKAVVSTEHVSGVRDVISLSLKLDELAELIKPAG